VRMFDDPIVVRLRARASARLAGRHRTGRSGRLPWILPPREAPTFEALSRWMSRTACRSRMAACNRSRSPSTRAC
jgi:hypothetical protein